MTFSTITRRLCNQYSISGSSASVRVLLQHKNFKKQQSPTTRQLARNVYTFFVYRAFNMLFGKRFVYHQFFKHFMDCYWRCATFQVSNLLRDKIVTLLEISSPGNSSAQAISHRKFLNKQCEISLDYSSCIFL